MLKRLCLAASAAALLLSGCETATPFQPLVPGSSARSGGYTDQQIETNRWRVTFSGNDLTSRETVEKYLLFRAAQLTANNGYDWFAAVDRHTDAKSSYYGDDFGFGGGFWGADWGYYRRGFGWGYGGWGDWGPGGFGGVGGGPIDIEQITQYQASTEIVMGHGPKPAGDRHAFDARAVIEHLQGSIAYPKTSAPR